MPKNADQLRAIKTFPQLVEYLRDELDWPVENYEYEDLTFTYEAAELGLKDEDAAKVKSIHQLRPLYQGQPWGIFFVEFENKKLPVVVLRRILSHLVVKKRASANRATQVAWNAEDLLFISAFGETETDQREIAFAHFQQQAGDLPTLNVLGWDGADTPLKLEHVAATLKDKLRWPKDEKNVNAWREQWRTPFQHRIGHVIRTADALAEHLASLARGIRERCKTMLAAESEHGALRKLYKAFQTALIHDASENDFADTYAQTITYGLLTAALSRTDMSSGKYGTELTADDVTQMVPITNPFLREMLQTFLKVGGRKNGIDFDELGIQDVVELLRGEETDLPAVVRDFGNRAPGEDPVIHFYEHFLSAYNKQLKIQRGVFYTPQPVVSYIVRSVHELLQIEFGLEDGLASTVTWGEMARRNPEIKIPDGTSPDAPFVTVLDPAVGTATFLVEVIDVIHKHLQAKWQAGGLQGMPILGRSALAERPPLSISFVDYWNAYVPQHLLPRLYGYELMMAPYAIAHMKIPLKLRETGFTAWGTLTDADRVRIYLTNSLEPPTDDKQITIANLMPALAHEAQAVNAVKRDRRFVVIIGNPPYSNFGRLNKNPFILKLLDDYKHGLNEKKLNLDDDYIKFIRLAHSLITYIGVGIIGIITNNSFFDGLSHRRMRQSLLETFNFASLLNLGGSVMRGEVTSGDENVFDIQQGVGISILWQMPRHNKTGSVRAGTITGTREAKYQSLLTKNAQLKPILCQAPYWFFVERSQKSSDPYNNYPSYKDIFKVFGPGIKAERDAVAIHFDRDSLEEVVKDFQQLSESELRFKYVLPRDSRDWQVLKAQADVIENAESAVVTRIQYRPFDFRWTWYSGRTRGLIGTPGYRVARQMLKRRNLGLITNRQIVNDAFSHVLVSSFPISHGTFYLGNKGQDYLAPLYLYDTTTSNQLSLGIENDHIANFTEAFLELLSNKLSLPKMARGNQNSVGPQDIFNYIYSILHCPTYRTRYAESLKIDFPRVPLTSNLDLFHALTVLGGELVELHLMESPKLDELITRYTGQQSPTVEKVRYAKETVWIDKAQTIGFQGVPQDVWEFHIGGYQVCEKWLKDRKGRQLSAEDITHYQRVVVALHETIRLMSEIDKVIDQYGGWPVK
jgi:hypothetical protein